MYDLSGYLTVRHHYLMVIKVRERLTVSKQAVQNFDVEKFNLRYISDH
jgi:DUF1365 family protein